jgi:hypothetical protein
MANEASWHLPSGPINWFVFACSLLFCLIGAFAAFAEPVASQGWWFGLDSDSVLAVLRSEARAQ